MYDVAIVGTGAAGLSSALNLRIHGKNFVWFGTRDLSDKISKAERVSNYPGFIDASGPELCRAFRAQIDAMHIDIVEQMVNSIMPMDDHYALMAGSDFYEVRALILACGIKQRGTLPHESEFVGKGVSYCATCDGGLYRAKTIAVICSQARFEHEVEYLASMAAHLYYFPTYRGSTIRQDNVELMDKPEQRVQEIAGQQRVTGVVLRNGQTIPVDGVFCLRDSIALETLLPGLVTAGGHIVVDRQMATNLKGVYAAGDCTGRPYQYTKAVGEGNIAAHSVLDYLSSRTA